MKDYQKPEVELINLMPEDAITLDNDDFDGKMSAPLNPFG